MQADEPPFRFVVDESSFGAHPASSQGDQAAMATAFEGFTVLLARRHEVGDDVAVSDGIWDADVGGATLSEVLFNGMFGDDFDEVARRALAAALNRCVELTTPAQDCDLPEAPWKGSAVAIAHAVASTAARVAVACVPLPGSPGRAGICLAGTPLHDPVPVHFVSDEGGVMTFFRTVLAMEELTQEALSGLVSRAFPQLWFHPMPDLLSDRPQRGCGRSARAS